VFRLSQVAPLPIPAFGVPLVLSLRTQEEQRSSCHTKVALSVVRSTLRYCPGEGGENSRGLIVQTLSPLYLLNRLSTRVQALRPVMLSFDTAMARVS
jgi:hypothetical protein